MDLSGVRPNVAIAKHGVTFEIRRPLRDLSGNRPYGRATGGGTTNFDILLESCPAARHSGGMLCVENEPLTDSDLAYIACRLSFFETLERIALADQMGIVGEGAYGYLSEVPYLRNAAPQVQLDALLDCWRKLRSEQAEPATLVDESVVYAVCETAARIVEGDVEFAQRHLTSGPRPVLEHLDGPLGDQLRFLHLSLPNEGHFLLLSQFQDVEPDAGERLKGTFGIEPAACEPMFDLLGRWHVSPEFRQNGAGLLTAAESAQAARILGLNQTASPW